MLICVERVAKLGGRFCTAITFEGSPIDLRYLGQ